MTSWKRPDHKRTVITAGFWKEQIDRIRQVTVWDVLDKFEHDRGNGELDESGSNQSWGVMKNFEWVAAGEKGKFIGLPCYDGLIYEVIRAASDFLAVSYDAKLDQKIDEYIEKINLAQEQEPDGYLCTYTTLMCQDKRWGQNGGSIILQHDIYNIGCLIDAGVHHYKATQKTKLLKCAVRAAQCMCYVMGPEPRKNIVPGHSMAEETLVKLYHLFQEEPELAGRIREEYGITVQSEKYLDLVKFWMESKGVHHNRVSFPRYMGENVQDHCKIEEQTEAVGHAVRAALLYTGLAALGIESGEEKYLKIVDRLWENVEQTKLHINGGIGAIYYEERFGLQYQLPNNAFLETCAGVAMAFWAGEMYRAFGKAKYMDAFEWVLYNTVMAGLSDDGRHYFYENPLISDGSIERWSWHKCPCCPPMFLKLISSLSDYIYAYQENSLAVNLQIESQTRLNVAGTEVMVEQKGCEIPWNGENHVILHMEKDTAFTLLIRKPAWAGRFQAEKDGKIFAKINENGYLVITQTFHDGDEIHLQMELPVNKVEAHPYVEADIGRVALTRGPLLYCLEEIDNPHGVEVTLDQKPLQIKESESFGKMVQLQGTSTDGQTFTALPYYLWNNRGKGKMNVWFKQEGKQSDGQSLSGWEEKLYRKYS